MARLYKAVIMGLLTGILGLIVILTPLGQNLEENIGLDLLFKTRKTRPIPSEVIIVTMDKPSCDHLNLPAEPYKWPRSLHARLIKNLVKEGAAVIIFDILFNDPRSLEHDHLLAKAISDAGNVVLCASLKQEIVPLTEEDGAHGGDLNLMRLVPPISPLAQSAVAFAPFPLPKIPIKLNQYWKFKTGAVDIPTLPVVALQIYALEVYDEFIHLLERISASHAKKFPKSKEIILKTKDINKLIDILKNTFESEPSLAERMLKALEDLKSIDTDAQKIKLLKSFIKMYQGPDSHYLNFFGPPSTIPTISYYQVLQLHKRSAFKQKNFDFKGKAVFIGVSECMRPDQQDGFYTVFSQSNGIDITGVEIAATAFANLLEGNHIQPLCSYFHIVSIFSWGFVVGFVCSLLPLIQASVSMIGLSILYLIAIKYQFKTACTWCPLVIPLFFQAPLAFLGATMWKHLDTFRERQNIRRAVGYFLPNHVVDQLAKKMVDFKKSRQIVYGICLYTDAEHYTSLSESLLPNELWSFMNKYYDTIFKSIKKHEGIVSDVVGDSMMAVWASTTKTDTLLRNQACLAALDIADMMKQFNMSSNTFQLPTRIGLHSGLMLLGTIGAIDHYEYRALGDIVNTTSRIEGLNKFLDTNILVSEEVLNQLDGFLTRELGQFLLLGKSKPIVIFELISRLEKSDSKLIRGCRIFEEALRSYRRQSWEEAIHLFYKSLKIFRKDSPSMFYINLCKRYKRYPPGENWNGLVCLNKK